MLIGLAIGVPAALCLARYRFRAREPLGNLLLLPLMVPGIVLGTALYVFHVEAPSRPAADLARSPRSWRAVSS